MTSEPDPIAVVSAAMRRRLDRLPRTSASRREFLQTYQRTTDAVGAAVRDGTFDDPEWVQRWDVTFAGLYLAALDADLSGSGGVPRPWRLAFDAPAALPPLRHVLLGINAHVNYDLPQALLMVIPDEEFAARCSCGWPSAGSVSSCRRGIGRGTTRPAAPAAAAGRPGRRPGSRRRRRRRSRTTGRSRRHPPNPAHAR